MYKLVIPIFLGIATLAVLANGIVIVALRNTRVCNATVTLILSLTISDIWYLFFFKHFKFNVVNLCLKFLGEILC